MGICGSGRNGPLWWRMSSDPNAKRSGQDFWLDQLEALGGRFWPPSPDEMESEMATVGAKFPMMLYNGGLECIVYDDKELEEAQKSGFRPHPSVLKAQEDEKKRKDDEAKAMGPVKTAGTTPAKEATADKKPAADTKK